MLTNAGQSVLTGGKVWHILTIAEIALYQAAPHVVPINLPHRWANTVDMLADSNSCRPR